MARPLGVGTPKPFCGVLKAMQTLDCCWVGSLDLNFLGNQGFSDMNPQNVIRFLQRVPTNVTAVHLILDLGGGGQRCKLHFQVPPPLKGVQEGC